MIARGFKSVGWVAAVGGAALGCYMVSLNVASERADLERIERQILAAKQDIKMLETELGTRGRFSQLEHWNAEVLALSAPAANQILPNEFKLASLGVAPPTAVEKAGNVRLASADMAQPDALPRPMLAEIEQAPQPQPVPMLRRASLVSTPKPAVAVKAPVAAPEPKKALAEPKKAVPEPVKLAAAVEPPVRKAAAPAAQPKKAGLFDGGLAKEINEAAKAETKQSNRGGASAR